MSICVHSHISICECNPITNYANLITGTLFTQITCYQIAITFVIWLNVIKAGILLHEISQYTCWSYISTFIISVHFDQEIQLFLVKQLLDIPDHHFDRIHADTEPFVSRDYIRHTSAAVGELGIKVHPLSRGRLGHDVDVNLQEITFHHWVTSFKQWWDYITRSTAEH